MAPKKNGIGLFLLEGLNMAFASPGYGMQPISKGLDNKHITQGKHKKWTDDSQEQSMIFSFSRLCSNAEWVKVDGVQFSEKMF